MNRPTKHQLAAAVQVARWIDVTGNTQEDVRAAYRTTATDYGFPPASLRVGEKILLATGLLRLVEGRLLPTPALATFVATNNERQAIDSLDRVLKERTLAGDRSEAGAAGEEFVLAQVVADLESLHRLDLAARCERVSLVSDWFGYDIAAPRIDGGTRRLEVKTQSIDEPPTMVRFFLSRNEYDTGRANPSEWALVMCVRSRNTGHMDVVGWCRAATLTAYLPTDQGGRWSEALVLLPASVLMPGLPAAV